MVAAIVNGTGSMGAAFGPLFVGMITGEMVSRLCSFPQVGGHVNTLYIYLCTLVWKVTHTYSNVCIPNYSGTSDKGHSK